MKSKIQSSVLTRKSDSVFSTKSDSLGLKSILSTSSFHMCTLGHGSNPKIIEFVSMSPNSKSELSARSTAKSIVTVKRSNSKLCY